MNGSVIVSLLETVVLLNVVKVVSANNDGSSHLVGNNHGSEDTTSNRNVTSERTLLVDVSTVDGLLWGSKTKADVLPPALGLSCSDTNWGSILSLESLLCLVSHIN